MNKPFRTSTHRHAEIGRATRTVDKERRRPVPAVCLLVVLLALLSQGCQSPPASVRREQTVGQTPMILSAGDVVSVSFAGTPELDQSQKIRSDGKISLPLVGEVQAAGKGPGELQDDLTSLYKPHLQNATILVRLQATSSVVYVSGAVGRQGKIVLERPMTALEAIMEAGGFSPGLANTKKVLLIRKEDGRYQTQVLDLSPTQSIRPVFYLKPYDMLIVQEKMF